MASQESSVFTQPVSAQLAGLGSALEPIVEYWDDVGITQRWASVLEGVERALRELDEAGQGAFLGAVEARLAGWADVSRLLPRAWYSAGALAAHAPLVGLCRAMVLTAADVEDVEAFAAMLSSPALQGVTRLELADVKLKPEALAALCAHRPLAVRALILSGCGLGVMAIHAMCSHERAFAGLTRLDLDRNKIPLRGAERLAECPQLAGLVVLNLRENPLTDAGRVALGKSVYLSKEAKVSARAIATAQLDVAPAPVEARAAFGDIRSVLQQAPSAQSWARICDLVSRIEVERATHETIPYAEAGLAAWPARERPLMAAWQAQIELGLEVPPAARLARAMTVSGYGFNAERGERLGRFAAQAGIERLLIEDGTPSFKALRALVVESGLRTLRDLDYRCDAVETTLKVLCEEPTYRLERLWLSRVDSDDPLDAVVRSAACAELRAFGIGFSRFGGEPWRALREAPWWWGLEALRLSRPTPQGVTLEQDPLLTTLLGGADEPAWGALTRLELTRLPTRSAGSAAAMEGLAARLPALDELVLDRVEPDSACWELLSSAPETLRSLKLGYISFDDASAVDGVQQVRGSGLRALELEIGRGYRDGDTDVVMRLLAAECFVGLTSLVVSGLAADDLWTSLALGVLPRGLELLELSGCVLQRESAPVLAAAPLERLKTLRLSGTQLSGDALRQLTEASWWAGLEVLSLETGYEDEYAALARLAGALPPGLRTLRITCGAEAPVLAILKGGLPAGLRALRLQHGAVASKGFKLLMEQLGSLPQLHTLGLDGNRIGPKSLPLLLDHPSFGQLAQIMMRSNRLGFEGKQMVLDSPVAPIAFKSAV